jgi:putative transposase
LSEHRNIAAATRFFKQAINKHGAPEKITLDGYAATHTSVRELQETSLLPQNVIIRKSKYLNNLIEQDHRRVKQRVYPMLGFIAVCKWVKPNMEWRRLVAALGSSRKSVTSHRTP